MQDLINRITQALGIDEALAEKAIGIILQTLQKQAPAETITPLLNGLPGAQDLITKNGKTAGNTSSGGGSLLSALGALTGGSMMESVSKLQEAGLNMGQIQSLAKETLAFAREKVGEDVVKKVMDAIPGLNQFL